MRQVRLQETGTRYYRAIGSAEALMLKAADLGQGWMNQLATTAHRAKLDRRVW